MRVIATVAAVAASCGGVLAQDIYLGFNSGATTDDGTVKTQDDYEREFRTAQQLQGSPGVFNSFRLYTNIQGGTTDTPIEAFPAAVATNTTLLLGLWASGTTNLDNELNALTAGIEQYGTDFTNLVVGISVGSEDLYRVSEPGIRNEAGVGQDADTIIGFIRDVRDRLQSTSLSNTPIGHVDTWTAWVNESNSGVIEESDFLGTNLFPYYEDDKGNDISNATTLFQNAINSTEAVAGDKPVWITETGWPATGPTFGQADATLQNSETYWREVGCTLFGRSNTWWYVLRDSNPDNQAKFAITEDLSTTPIFNISCPADSGAPTQVNNNPSGNGNGNGNANGSGGGSGAGSLTSVSHLNMMALALSMVAALAAWIA